MLVAAATVTRRRVPGGEVISQSTRFPLTLRTDGELEKGRGSVHYFAREPREGALHSEFSAGVWSAKPHPVGARGSSEPDNMRQVRATTFTSVQLVFPNDVTRAIACVKFSSRKCLPVLTLRDGKCILMFPARSTSRQSRTRGHGSWLAQRTYEYSPSRC